MVEEGEEMYLKIGAGIVKQWLMHALLVMSKTLTSVQSANVNVLVANAEHWYPFVTFQIQSTIICSK